MSSILFIILFISSRKAWGQRQRQGGKKTTLFESLPHWKHHLVKLIIQLITSDGECSHLRSEATFYFVLFKRRFNKAAESETGFSGEYRLKTLHTLGSWESVKDICPIKSCQNTFWIKMYMCNLRHQSFRGSSFWQQWCGGVPGGALTQQSGCQLLQTAIYTHTHCIHTYIHIALTQSIRNTRGTGDTFMNHPPQHVSSRWWWISERNGIMVRMKAQRKSDWAANLCFDWRTVWKNPIKHLGNVFRAKCQRVWFSLINNKLNY